MTEIHRAWSFLSFQGVFAKGTWKFHPSVWNTIIMRTFWGDHENHPGLSTTTVIRSNETPPDSVVGSIHWVMRTPVILRFRKFAHKAKCSRYFFFFPHEQWKNGLLFGWVWLQIHFKYSFSNNHRSGRWPHWKLKSSSRASVSTSMIMRGSVCFCFFQENKLFGSIRIYLF